MRNIFESLNKKKDRLYDEYEEFVEGLIGEYWDFCGELGGAELQASSYVTHREWDIRRIEREPFSSPGDSLAIYRNAIEKRKGELTSKVSLIKEQTKDFWTEANKNKESLNVMDGNAPLFFTLTSLEDKNHKIFCMCYEFKKVEDGLFTAYVFTNGAETGRTMEISYLEYSISPMTEEEFEKYYIMGRMNVSTYFREDDAIEYDNSVRKLFLDFLSSKPFVYLPGTR